MLFISDRIYSSKYFRQNQSLTHTHFTLETIKMHTNVQIVFAFYLILLFFLGCSIKIIKQYKEKNCWNVEKEEEEVHKTFVVM